MNKTSDARGFRNGKETEKNPVKIDCREASHNNDKKEEEKEEKGTDKEEEKEDKVAEEKKEKKKKREEKERAKAKEKEREEEGKAKEMEKETENKNRFQMSVVQYIFECIHTSVKKYFEEDLIFVCLSNLIATDLQVSDF